MFRLYSYSVDRTKRNHIANFFQLLCDAANWSSFWIGWFFCIFYNDLTWSVVAVDKIEIKEEIEKLETEVKNSIEKIDTMVYKLYGLSSDEVRIVEGV